MPTIPISREYSGDSSDQFGQAPARVRVMPSGGGPGEEVRFGESASPSADQAADAWEHQARYNEAAVTAAHGQFLDANNAVLHGGSGAFMGLTGADAVHGAPAAQKALADAYQQLSDNLQNDTQRAMFGRVTAPTIAAALELVRQHTSGQLAQYEADASHARASAAADAAVNAYNPAPGADNRLYRQNILTQKIELEKQADRHGLTLPAPTSPDYEEARARRDEFIQRGADGRSGIASTYSNIITRLLNSDQVQGAQDFFDQVRDALPGATRDKIGGYIAAGREKHEGLGAALRVKSQTADFARQQELLDNMRNDGAIGPAAYDLARQKLSADAARVANEQAANDSHILGSVRDLKNANPNAALTDLAAGDYAYLKSRGLDQHANAILDGHPATDDPALFNQLHRQSVEDPVGFGKLNLATVAGQMNKAHFDVLSSAQNAINQQNPKDIDGLRLINRTVDGLTADMQAAGFNTNPEPGSADAEKHAGFEAGLRDTLIAAQQAKNGTPLTGDEARGIALGYLKDQVLSGSGYFAPAKGDEGQSGDAQGGATEDGSDTADDGEAAEDDAAPNGEKREQEQADKPSQEEEHGGDSGTGNGSEAGQQDEENQDQPEGSEAGRSAQDANDEWNDILRKDEAAEDQRIRERAAGKQGDAQPGGNESGAQDPNEAEMNEIVRKEMAREEKLHKQRGGRKPHGTTSGSAKNSASEMQAGEHAQEAHPILETLKKKFEDMVNEVQSFLSVKRIQKPQGQPESETKEKRHVDLNKMMEHLWANAADKPDASCATKFRLALEAAGGDSTGRPEGAKDWGDTLERNGFEKVSKDNYEPQHGDVTIYPAVPPKDPKHPKPAEKWGHIQAYDANHKRQVSDYKQNNPTPPVFKNAPYEIYRYRP